jgi:hypothetical protein
MFRAASSPVLLTKIAADRFIRQPIIAHQVRADGGFPGVKVGMVRYASKCAVQHL